MKSRVTARPVKREEMPDKRWQRGRGGGRKGRKRGAGGEWEWTAFNKGERQMENIHKVSEGRRAECVWRRRKTEGEEGVRGGSEGGEGVRDGGRESRVCIFA